MKLKIYGIFLLFLVIVPCFAQREKQGTTANVISITPDKAVEMAMENNLSLKQTMLGNEAKRRAAQMPWNVFIPTVELSGTLGRLNIKPEARNIVLPGLTIPISPGGPQWVLLGSFQVGLTINIGTFAGMKQTLEEYAAGIRRWKWQWKII